MSFHSWLQSVRSTLATGGCQCWHRQRGSIRAATHRPYLETLEDRLTPSFTWGGTYSGWGPVSPPPPLSADVTSDGIDDLIDLDWDGVVVRPGRGDGTFGDPIFSPTFSPFLLAVDDFNADGRLDAFTASAGGAGGDFGPVGLVLLGRGDGTFAQLPNSSFGLMEDPRGVGTGDFDGDGRRDVAISGFDFGEQVVELLLNDGIWPNSPKLRIGGASVTEGNTGTVEAVFTVTLENGPNQPVTVQYTTADGGATAGADYQATAGTLTFAPGETSKTISVLVTGDRIPEGSESFYVSLSEPTNAVITGRQAPGTIVDDEPAISVADAVAAEGDTGTRSASFTVMLSLAYDMPVAVSYVTTDGTATAGSDYQAASDALTFAPGETRQTITVLVNGDRLIEPNETFSVYLSSPTNATIADGVGVTTILDDEPRISISDVTRYEGTGNKTTLFVFTVTHSAAYDQAVTMSYRTADGTATTGDSDYIAKTGTLTFAPGETSKTITIEVKRDRKSEANETFYLDLFDNSSNSLFTKSRGIGRIWNDD